MTHTHEIISEKYGGPLIPLEAVAEILGRKPNSIRILLKRSNGDQDLADRLRQCQAKLGRRLLFRVSDIARMIDEA